MRQISMYLTDLEMNWRSNFLVKSEKLVIVLQLLLAPVNTVVNTAEHEIAPPRSPIPVASRCFPLNHMLTLSSTSGRTKVWHVNPRFQWTGRLRWNACNPGLQQTNLAHDLQNKVVPSKRHSVVAVELGKIVQLAGRLIKIKKKCDIARQKWDVKVLGRNADTVLRDLSHANAWDQCATVHHDNKTATRLRNNCAWEDVVRGKCTIFIASLIDADVFTKIKMNLSPTPFVCTSVPRTSHTGINLVHKYALGLTRARPWLPAHHNLAMSHPHGRFPMFLSPLQLSRKFVPSIIQITSPPNLPFFQFGDSLCPNKLRKPNFMQLYFPPWSLHLSDLCLLPSLLSAQIAPNTCLSDLFHIRLSIPRPAHENAPHTEQKHKWISLKFLMV